MKTEEPSVLPVYVVTATNWTCIVNTDEFNSQFSQDHQIMAAAVTAIEAFYHIRDDVFITLNPGEKEAELGTAILVSPQEDSENQTVIPTFILLADAGLYLSNAEKGIKGSIEMQELFYKEVKELETQQKRQEAEQTARATQIKKFETLKKDFPAKKKPDKKKKS